MVLPGTRRELLPSWANPSPAIAPALVMPKFQVHQASVCWQKVGPR